MHERIFSHSPVPLKIPLYPKSVYLYHVIISRWHYQSTRPGLQYRRRESITNPIRQNGRENTASLVMNTNRVHRSACKKLLSIPQTKSPPPPLHSKKKKQTSSFNPSGIYSTHVYINIRKSRQTREEEEEEATGARTGCVYVLHSRSRKE